VKKEIIPPAIKEDSLQAIIDFLIDNGMSEFSADMFIHMNIPALGGDRSILNCAQEEKWEDAWRVSQAYIDGDYF
jgi:hypothetical protein